MKANSWGRAGLICAVLGLGPLLLRCSSSSSDDSAGAGTAGAVGGAGTGMSGASGNAGGKGGASAAGSSGAAQGGQGGTTAGTSAGGAGTGDSGAPGDAAGATDDLAGAGGALADETLSFVFNQEKLPTSNAQFAVDLDGNAVADNAYGRLMATLTTQGIDGQSAASAEIAAGRGLQLLDLTVPNSNLAQSTGVQSELMRAVTTASPVFTGNGSFHVDDAAPTAALPGAIASGIFKSTPVEVGTKPGKVLMRLVFGAPVDIPVSVLSMTYQVTPSALAQGQLNGAISAADVDLYVPPALTTYLQGTCIPMPQTATCKSLLTIFDKNADKIITVDEVRGNNVIKDLLGSDVKLFDAQGHFAPDPDSVQKDSFSVGVGLSAVAAVIVH